MDALVSSMPPVPDYVKAVMDEFATVRLEPAARSPQPLPVRTSPIVISVIKNEGDRIADLLRHYREAGIERFCLIDNGSTDGSLEFLAGQPDVDVWLRPGPFDWKLKQGWINRAIADYGHDRWYIYIDADEHIVFDGLGQRGFRDLVLEMEARGIRRVRGFLLDMYGEGPLLRSSYQPGGRLLDAYPFHDRTGYAEHRYKQIMSVKGGPRTRAFEGVDAKFKPEMTKYPLFRLRSGEFMANPHHIWPYDDNFVSPRLLAVLHFKFLPNILHKIQAAIAEKSYWDGSLEYRCYHETLLKRPELSLHGEPSTAYVGPAELVAAGLIAPVGWLTSNGAVQHMLMVRARRQAQLRAEQGGHLLPLPPQLPAELPGARAIARGSSSAPELAPARPAPAKPDASLPAAVPSRAGTAVAETQVRAEQGAHVVSVPPYVLTASASPGVGAVAPANSSAPAPAPTSPAEPKPEAAQPTAAADAAGRAESSRPVPAPAAQPTRPPVPDITVNEAFSGKGGHRKIDVTVEWPEVPGAPARRARFRLGIDDGMPVLTFRRGPAWPLFTDDWPGQEQDHFGPFFRLCPSDDRAAILGQIPDGADRDCLRLLIDGLPKIVTTAAAARRLPAETAAAFLGAAEELRASFT